MEANIFNTKVVYFKLPQNIKSFDKKAKYRNVTCQGIFEFVRELYGNPALSSRPSPKGVNYNPRVELIAKDYQFYMGLYSEIFRNLLVAKHKNYGYQF